MLSPQSAWGSGTQPLPKDAVHAKTKDASTFRDSMVDMTQMVLKEGVLEKHSSGMLKQWHRRYWILTPKYLRYWGTKEESAGEKSSNH